MATERSKYSIRDAVLKVVGDHLGIPSSTLSLNDQIMRNLGADIYDQLELTMTIEELFDVKFPQGKAEKIVTIGEIIEILEKLLPPQSTIEL